MTNPTPSIRTLSISFDLPVFARQLSQWRGAFIEMAGWQDDLFHNHKAEREYVYRYPLIQYRLMRGKAGLFAINEGVDALQKVLAETDWEINWQGKKCTLNVEHLQMDEHFLRMITKPRTYRLYKWVPMYAENYKKWKKAKNLIERITLLQNILTKQVEGFCEAMNYVPESPIKIDIQHIQLMEDIRIFNTQMIAFNIDYSANILLPKNIGLGRGISKGFGWQKAVKKSVKRHREKQNVAKKEIE